MSLDELSKQWADPPSIYRGAPFWSWNSKLDPERLCRQIELMHGAGMGGFFMHSRYGLKTQYLSDEWFACVGACVEKARGLGMKAYLYDEDRWPSGPAGGIVTRPHPEFRCHYLLARDPRRPVSGVGAGHPSAGPSEDAGGPEAHRVAELGTFVVRRDEEGRLTAYDTANGVAAEAAPTEGEPLTFEVYTETPTGWTNDGGYLDTMDPEAVAEYVHVTHEEYAKRQGNDFGGVIPALFTDEPNYGFWNAGAAAEGESRIVWTRRMLEEFRARRAYDLAQHLPELVLPVAGGFSKVRYDYHRTATELFVEHFSRHIGEWCAEHRIALTGHYLLEGALGLQTKAVGACMPHYEYMQWPGIDILTDQTSELITAKQCSSVADQLGKQRVLSELYGCTGWDWPLEGHKFQGDWQFAAGVNFRCQHLTHYSLAGGAKRDYPASIIDHSPWWAYYRTVEDYFGRLSLMLTRGRPVRDVLLIHPIESAWGLFCQPTNEQPARLQEIEAALTRMMYALIGQHYDWDFGDESLMVRHAEVTGDTLKIGQMSYRLVIVPPCVTLRSSTVELLTRFQAGGGRLLFVGTPPDHIDAEPGDALATLIESAARCEDDEEELIGAVESLLDRRVQIVERGLQQECMWAMQREIEGGQLLFIQSHDRENAHRVHVTAPGRMPVVLWDALTGRRTNVDAEMVGDTVGFYLDVPPTGSALLTMGLEVPDAVQPPPEREVVETLELKGPYAVELAEPNTLPLDYCQFSIGDEGFSELVPTLKADALIRARYGLGTRLGNEHQPWYLYATGVVDTTPRDTCRMRWVFHVTDVPSRCALALENPQDYEITINGEPVGKPSGHWVDQDIKTIDITSLARPGNNEVLLTFDYRPDMELEDLYLVGDFGVTTLRDEPLAPGNTSLVAPVSELEWGSWVNQGLPFYGAAAKYRLVLAPDEPADAPDPILPVLQGRTAVHALRADASAEGAVSAEERAVGRRVRLRLPHAACTAAAVHLNGRTFVLPWPPFEVDITDALREEGNEVVVEIIGGRKNILGPLHTPWGPGTGPHSFSPDHGEWRSEYYLTEHGLMDPVVVEVLE